MGGRRGHSLTWVKFRFNIGLVCLLIIVMFVGLNSLAHNWTSATIFMIMLSIMGIWYFWIKLPLGDRKRRLQHIRTLGDLLACTPREFERLVGDILAETGYRSVRYVGGSGDLAADLTCRDQDGKTVVVQCKRYVPGNRVGSPDIQQFIGMMAVHHKADIGVFVTTSDFSRPAIDLARRHDITLMGGRELTHLVHKVQKQHDGAEARQKTP